MRERRPFGPWRWLTGNRRAAKGGRSSRTWRPRIEGSPLEDRIAPAVGATVSSSGATLMVLGNSRVNLWTMSVNGANTHLVVTDALNQFSVTSALIASGVTGNNTNTINIPLSFLNTFTNVLISAGTGSDLLTTNSTVASPITVAPNLSLQAPTILANGTAPIMISATTRAASFTGTVVNNSTAATMVTTNGGNIGFSNQVNANTSLSLSTGATLLGTISIPAGIVSGNNLNVTLTGNSISAGKVTKPGTGTFTINAQNDASLTNDLDAGTGAVVINANLDGAGSQGFTQVAGGITTVNNTVTITVNSATAGSGGIAVRSINSGNGAITLDSLTAANTGGAIVSSGSTNRIRTTGNLTVTAGNGIQINTALGAASVLSASTQAATSASPVIINNSNSGALLTVNNLSTTNGAISVTQSGPLTITGTNTAGGTAQNVTLMPTGDLTIGAAATINSTGGTLSLFSSGGAVLQAAAGTTLLSSGGLANLSASTGIGTNAINIGATVDSLTATTASGGVFFTNTTSLSVNFVVATAGDIAVTASGGTSDLTLNGNVTTSSGSVSLTAGQDLDQVTGMIASQAANLSLQSGRDLTVTGTVKTNTSGDITITSGTATNSTMTVSGTVVSNGGITVQGGANVDTLDLSGTLAGVNAFSILGGAGTDTIDAMGVLHTTLGPILIDGGTDNDLYCLAPSLTTTFNIADSGGVNDVLQYEASASYTATIGVGTVSFTGGYQSWTFSGIDAPVGTC